MELCNHCQKSFSNLNNLKTHQKNKHGIVPTKQCACGYVNENFQGLNAHFRHCVVHREGRPPAPPGNKGKPSLLKGKTLEQIAGSAEKAQITRQKLATARAGQKCSPSLASKRKMSESRIRVLETSPHVKWFEVAGVKVQGGWEKIIAEKLLNQKIKFIRSRLKYDGHRTYTPDFYLPEQDLYLEVKGWLSERDKNKYTRVLLDHPDIQIRMILGKKGMHEFDAYNLHLIPHMSKVISAGG